MKNNKSQDLQQLLLTTSSGEKRITRQALQNSPNPSKLALLYDLLLSQESPETQHLTLSQAGYTSDFLAADRNELYNLLLDTLALANTPKSGELQTYQAISRIVLLFERKLFDQCLKQIHKALKLAQQYELLGATLEILKYKQRTLKALGQINAAVQLHEPIQALLIQQNQLIQLSQLHFQSVQLRILLAKARHPDQLAHFQSIIHLPILQQPLPNHFYPEFHRLEILCNYAFVQDQLQAELLYNQALLDLFHAFPHFQKDQPLNYLVVRTRILTIRRRLFPESFLAELRDYRSLPEHFPKQQYQAESIVFIFSYNYELDTYLQQKNWPQALLLLPDMLQKLKKYQPQVSDEFRLTCHYRAAYTYFFAQQYPDVLQHLHTVLHDFPPTLRPDVHHVALIFQIILHYELHHQRLLLHLVQTTKYNLKKQATLYKTERIVIQALHRLAQLQTAKASLRAFLRLRDQLLEIFADPYEKRVLEIFDFLHWVQIKIDAFNAQNLSK